jgi:hypothetical protein
LLIFDSDSTGLDLVGIRKAVRFFAHVAHVTLKSALSSITKAAIVTRMSENIPDSIREYMQEIGRRGGTGCSERKRRALRENSKKGVAARLKRIKKGNK